MFQSNDSSSAKRPSRRNFLRALATAGCVAAAGSLLIGRSDSVSAAENLGKCPFYTGYILPTPQKVKYGIRTIPLYDLPEKRPLACIVVPGDGRDDPLVEDFSQRLAVFGAKLPVFPTAQAGKAMEAYDNVLVLGELEKNPLAKDLVGKNEIALPDRKEGYVLHLVGEGGQHCFLAIGNDKLGGYWAMQSLRQLVTVRDNRVVLEAADVYDFPAVDNLRSYSLSNNDRYFRNLGLAYKFNAVILKKSNSKFGGGKRALNWRDIEQSELEDMVEDCRFLLKRGIKVVHYMCFVRGKPEDKIAVSSAEDLKKVSDIIETFFKGGIDVLLAFDDTVYPTNPKDIEKFGKANARSAHAHFMNHLSENLLSRYPKREIVFCPPFYQNPNQWLRYIEDHKEYLNHLRDNSPKQIVFSWTGPITTSWKVSSKDLKWWRENVGRRIHYWDNAFHGGHTGKYDGWYYFEKHDFAKRFPPEFLTNIHHYTIFGTNSWCGPTGVLLADVSDYLWNQQAHTDAEKSLHKSIGQVAGPETTDLCLKWREQICRFDPYVFKVDQKAKDKLSDFNIWYKQMEETFADIKQKSQNERLVKTLGNLNGRIKRFIDRVSKLESNGETKR